MKKFSSLFDKKGKKTFIIAEIGNNHEGSLEVAKKLITQAKKCGVDAVKFQTFIPELFVSEEDKKRFLQLKKFQLTFKEFSILGKFSIKLGLNCFSAPQDLDSAKFLNKIQKFFKIASSDNDFYPLIKLVSSFNKTLMISTGLANIKTINRAKKIVFQTWKKQKKRNRKLILMHCVSNYPVESHEANLMAILTLKKKFKECLIGYSDHTVGNVAALSAVALGAKVIEKHFTLNKNYSNFRDHKLSADPSEMEDLVKNIRRLELMLGSGEKKLQNSEKKMLKFLRRKPVASRNLFKNKKIKAEDIKWIRLKRKINDISIKNTNIINKRPKINIYKNQIIFSKNLK